jgi:hypothetical protein
MSSILVGLDLSPSSRAALPWAAEQARLTGRRLLAVSSAAGCWRSRACGLSPAGLGFGEPLLPESREMPTVIVPVDNRAVSTGNSSNRPQGCETEMLPISLRTPQAWGHNETRKPSCD